MTFQAANSECWFYPEDVKCSKRNTKICNKWCDKYLLYSALVQQSELPKRFQKYFLWNFPGPHDSTNMPYTLVKTVTSNWARYFGDGKGLYLYSNQVGTGKTTAAVTIANEYMASIVWKSNMEPYVVYVVVPELLERIKDSFRQVDDELAELMENIQTVPLVIWDDIGVERPTDWVRERLYTLINKRYTEELSNIFTSNLTLDELEQNLERRIVSRIRGTCHVIGITGEDKRRVNGE